MKKTILLTAAAATALSLNASAQFQGPSTGSTPYAVPTQSYVNTYSIFTVDNTGANPDDSVGGYSMAGIPDGLGAYDNGDDTFTVLMNHEIGSGNGTVRAHGNAGAFVSKWVVNKNTLAVSSGSDLITSVRLWNSSNSTYNAPNNTLNPMSVGFGRFCSADLPSVNAFYNSSTLLGTQERIFMNGEEIGTEGRAFATVVTGTNAGTTWELPRLGKFSWENSVANPTVQNKTVVMGLDDGSGTNQGVYMYVGTKTNTGSEVDRAGLTNGLLYGVKIDGNATQQESRTSEFGITKGNTKPFSMVLGPNSGNVSSSNGTALDAHSAANGVSSFLRPEDGAWDPTNLNNFYFVTTDRYDGVKDVPFGLTGNISTQVGRSRLWKLEFSDVANPESGGNIRLMLDGTEAGNMFDNISVDATGKVQIVEDVGNQQHNGKLWEYNPADGSLTMLAKHDQSRFGDVGVAATSPFNQDEEFSGNIEVTSLMAGSALSSGNPNERWFLMVDQAHYTTNITASQVEGGQLIMVQTIPEPSTYALLGLAAAAIGFAVRRRKNA